MAKTPEPMGLSDLLHLGTLNHWARADAANGTGAELFAAYSTVELGVQAYRRFGVDRKAEEKTAQAKREFHEGVAEYAKADPAFKKARPAQQKELLEKEVARQVALLSIKLQLIGGARPEDLSL